MDEAAHKIEVQIDRTRERLGSNLRELEHRIDVAAPLCLVTFDQPLGRGDACGGDVVELGQEMGFIIPR